MLETIIKLLERFVVAHELIAANSAKPSIEVDAAAVKQHIVDSINTGAIGDAIKGNKAKPEEDDLADGEPDEEKPKTRKQRATKPKAEPEPDLDKLREEIEVMAKHIGSGDSDDCADELDDLLDEYDARSVKRIKDDEVQKFHKELKAIVAKYYRIEED